MYLSWILPLRCCCCCYCCYCCCCLLLCRAEKLVCKECTFVNASSHSLSSRFYYLWACSMKAEYKLITRSKEQYKQYQREELKNSSVFYFWDYLMVPSRKMAITFVHYIYRLPCSLHCLHLDRNIRFRVRSTACGASLYLYF